MGRKRKPKCNHNDCFTCPYDDCIIGDFEVNQEGAKDKRGPGRPKLPPGLVHKHQLEYARKHYQETKEERALWYKEYYQRNKEKIKKQQKEYRERRKANG